MTKEELRNNIGKEEELISKIMVRERLYDRVWALLPVAMLLILALIGYYGP